MKLFPVNSTVKILDVDYGMIDRDRRDYIDREATITRVDKNDDDYPYFVTVELDDGSKETIWIEAENVELVDDAEPEPEPETYTPLTDVFSQLVPAYNLDGTPHYALELSTPDRGALYVDLTAIDEGLLGALRELGVKTR